MKRRRSNFLFLVLAILSLLTTAYLIDTFDPGKPLPINGVNISPISPLIGSIFLFVFFSTVFLLKSKRRGLFAGLFVVFYLLLAVFNLKHPFFIVLIGAFFVILDRFYSQR